MTYVQIVDSILSLDFSCVGIHGGLYRWRENSLPFFLFQKLKEIFTWYSRTILKASKN